MAVQAGAMGPRNGMSPTLIISAERVAFVVETREKAIRRAPMIWCAKGGTGLILLARARAAWAGTMWHVKKR